MRKDIEYMPDEYKLKPFFHTGHQTYTRRWSKKEEEWLKYLLSKNYTRREIAESMGRSIQSIIDKRKKMRKKDKTYNEEHSQEKREINKKFLEEVKPVTVLDCYCGENNIYNEYELVTNDINRKINSDYHMDAHKLLCKLYSEDKTFDLIDLDPFGSAYDCFDLAIKMANKGLCITLGEMNLRRFAETEYVKYRYNINNLDDFNSDNLIKKIQIIGIRNKKDLRIFCKKDWNHISRVWFKISPMKRRGEEFYRKKTKKLESEKNLNEWM